jgi:hypothetical protein
MLVLLGTTVGKKVVAATKSAQRCAALGSAVQAYVNGAVIAAERCMAGLAGGQKSPHLATNEAHQTHPERLSCTWPTSGPGHSQPTLRSPKPNCTNWAAPAHTPRLAGGPLADHSPLNHGAHMPHEIIQVAFSASHLVRPLAGSRPHGKAAARPRSRTRSTLSPSPRQAAWPDDDRLAPVPVSACSGCARPTKLCPSRPPGRRAWRCIGCRVSACRRQRLSWRRLSSSAPVLAAPVLVSACFGCARCLRCRGSPPHCNRAARA